MKGKGEAHGAISVLNAIAGGLGCSLGVKLQVKAEVEIIEDNEIFVYMDGVEYTDRDLIATKIIIRKTIDQIIGKKAGAIVRTRSDIPISRGLKSSSASSNAIILALLAATGKRLNNFEVLECGVQASLEAGVTITGAFDDACASFFGGYCITDNINMKLIKREEGQKGLKVVIHVPDQRFEKKNIDVEMLKKFKIYANEIFGITNNGKYFEALTLNGLLYSAALGFDPKIAIQAISNGAYAAGLSGTGPATVIICNKDNIQDICRSLSDFNGNILRTEINNDKAKMKVDD